MQAQAVGRYLKITPRKARQVADLIRAKNVGEALQLLAFTRKRAARVLEGVLRSALANANQKGRVQVERLHIRSIQVDQGPQLRWAKRWMPRAMGRASGLHHRTSHVRVILSDENGKGKKE